MAPLPTKSVTQSVREDVHVALVAQTRQEPHGGDTLAAPSGASARELMGRMGHASSRAALRHQHLVRTDQGIADAMCALIRATTDPAGDCDEGG